MGGITLLHEITHLDAVGELAEYSEVKDSEGFESRGTEDVGSTSPSDSPPLQARKLLKLWKSGKANPANTLEPYRNAESIAAAAFGK